jgi:hypothetical protein
VLDYRSKRNAYDLAVATYNSRRRQLLAAPGGQETWEIIEPVLRRNIEDAMADWVASGKNEIENAQAIVTQYGPNVLTD